MVCSLGTGIVSLPQGTVGFEQLFLDRGRYLLRTSVLLRFENAKETWGGGEISIKPAKTFFFLSAILQLVEITISDHLESMITKVSSFILYAAAGTRLGACPYG